MRWLVAIALFLGACGRAATVNADTAAGPEGDPAAIAVCDHRGGYEENTTVVGAYSTTIGALVRWENAKNPPGWGEVRHEFEQGAPDDRPVTLCFLDGEFAVPSPGPGAESNRGAIAVESDGTVQSLMFGHHDTPGYTDLAVERP